MHQERGLIVECVDGANRAGGAQCMGGARKPRVASSLASATPHQKVKCSAKALWCG